LAEGVKFVVIAVKAADSTYVSHAEYTIVGGSPALSGGEAAHVPAGGSYRFICVSLNSTTLSPVDYHFDTFEEGMKPTFANIPNTVDLLYWTSENILVNENKTLPVILRHKADYVKVKVNSSYNEWNILGINANSIRFSSYNTITLNAAGAVSGSAAKKPVSWHSSLTADTIQESRGDTVYLSKLDIEFAANALTLSAGTTPSAVTTATFNNVPFTSGLGNRYILTVKLKSPKFANSNIYWDGTKLTFDAHIDSVANPVSYVARKSEQRKQGVHFKWGSLIGIAGRSHGVDYHTWSSDSTIYIPVDTDIDLTNHIAWLRTTTAAAQNRWAWSGYTGYRGIPYVNVAASPYGRTNKYLNTLFLSTTHIYKYRGDICHYLNSNYRMPYSDEFASAASSWIWGGEPYSYVPTDIFGQDLIEDSRCATLIVNRMFFPGSGGRSHIYGELFNVGNAGAYWSSSAKDGTNAYCLYFRSTIIPDNSLDRDISFPVRCVLQE
jgi:hypothetical protein